MRLIQGEVIDSYDIANLMSRVALRDAQPWWERWLQQLNARFWSVMGG